jgi:hypothetical protein
VSKKRGGRRSRARPSAGEHEHFYRRAVTIKCPAGGHVLGKIRQDTVRTDVRPEWAAGVTQKFRRIDDTLYGFCVWCQRRGSTELLGVSWASVDGLLEQMRKHGPQFVTVILTTDAIERVANALPVV